MNLYSTFKSALDFRKSLEARLQALAFKTKEDLQRLRRKVAFDRFLARIFSQGQTGFFLKGGYAMELRIAHARATRDIDLTFIQRVKNKSEILNALIFQDLQALASIDLQDHFVYQIGTSKINLENAPYGGWRYPVTALIHNKVFVEFHIDLGGDFLLDKTETICGTDWLQFCHIPPPKIPMISIEQQLAEKLHAFTLPRGDRMNTRVKDLVDMVLLLAIRTPDPTHMTPIFQKVFNARNTHSLPLKLEQPPVQWDKQFMALATECGIDPNMQIHFETVSKFYTECLKAVH